MDGNGVTVNFMRFIAYLGDCILLASKVSRKEVVISILICTTSAFLSLITTQIVIRFWHMITFVILSTRPTNLTPYLFRNHYLHYCKVCHFSKLYL